MYMNRKLASQMGQETISILAKGHYQIEEEIIDIQKALDLSVENTIEYPPHTKLPQLGMGTQSTQFRTHNETTLQAARTLVKEGHRVAALNFASAKNPGGGFQKGSRAQEESLARSSGLFACIDGRPMYHHHRSMRSCMYSNYAIYSPDVPVIRGDEGNLLREPYLCSFLTSPAVNAKIVQQRGKAKRKQIKEVMRERVNKILTIAAIHEHDALVLGAWGCGVFGNNVEDMAELFDEALCTTFRGFFQAVTFAILDSSREQRFIGPFLNAFGQATKLEPEVSQNQ